MMLFDPILITAPPRSGTTMIAGLLAKHGVWIGRARTSMFPKTNSHFGSENQDIKDFLKQELAKEGKKWNHFPLTNSKLNPEALRSRIEELVPKDTRWLVKTEGILYHPEAWLAAFPRAWWVLPRRKIKDVIKSMEAHPSMRKRKNKKQKIKAVRERQDRVSRVVEKAKYVSAEDIINDPGVYARDLVEFCGLDFDPEATSAWIDPSLWKQWEKER